MVIAASGDPFYVFKDELQTQVSEISQQFSKWRNLFVNGKDVKEQFSSLTYQLEKDVATAMKSIKFLRETIVMVETNRDRFGHIDEAEIASRKTFVAMITKELEAVSLEISTDVVKAKRYREEDTLMIPARSAEFTTSSLTEQERNERFMNKEKQQQHQTIQEQDTSCAELHTDITRLHKATIEIAQEAKLQNKMLENLTNDVDKTQVRMDFMMKRLSKFLQTKDKCQLGLILFLVVVLVVMIFLVIYT